MFLNVGHKGMKTNLPEVFTQSGLFGRNLREVYLRGEVPMSEANVEQHEVEDPQPQINDEDVTANEVEDTTRGEWFKFGIVAVVLLFTVLIIALLRPLIFGKIVPAVLGENQPAAPLVSSPTEAETIKPDSEAEDAVVEEEVAEPEESAESPTDGVEEVTEPEQPADFPTAVPAQNHTVQVGETLTAIAKQYSTTVQAIVEANNIPNPNRVNAGTELIIPVGSDQ